jgi:hypothetical protein
MQETPVAKRPTDISQLAKSIIDEATKETRDKNPAAVSLGRLGGLKAAKHALKVNRTATFRDCKKTICKKLLLNNDIEFFSVSTDRH